MKNTLGSIYGLTLLCFISCSNDHETGDDIISTNYVSINQQIVEIENGRLSFGNSNEFRNAINSILNERAEVDGDKFKSRTRSIDFELELKSASISDDEYITDSDSLVCSDAFCAVLNEKHEVQIGGVLVKITPIGTIFTDVRDTILLKNIVFDSMFLSNCVKTSNALGIFAEEGLYKNETFKGVYLFDTYSLLMRIKG